MVILHMKELYQKSLLSTCMMCGTISDTGLYWNASFDGDDRDMDERRKFDEINDIREIWDKYSNPQTYL